MKAPVIKVMTFVLDDQEIVLKGIEHAFNSRGIRDYHLFTDYREFLDAANDDVHIAVIDYLLASTDEVSGVDVCKQLLKKNPRCYVIIMSGQSDMDVVIDFMNSGAWRYVKKYGRYIIDVLAYVEEAAEKIAQDLKFYTTLIEKHNQLTYGNPAGGAANGHDNQ